MSLEPALNSLAPPNDLSRRWFLKAAAAVAAPCFVPGAALGLAGNVAASNRIAMGILGVGVRGADAIQRMLPLSDGQVVAVSDVRTPRREAAVRMVEGFYADAKARGSYQGCTAYHDFLGLLGGPISTPSSCACPTTGTASH